VLDLGGKLRVETAPGRGTRVIVELPLAADSGERSV
jgi:signal transduction histidine kinase